MSNQNKRVISGQKLGVPQLRHRRNEIWLTLTYLIQIQCSFLSRRLQIKLVNGLLLLCSQCFTALLKILRVESCPKPCVIHAKTRRGHPKRFFNVFYYPLTAIEDILEIERSTLPQTCADTVSEIQQTDCYIFGLIVPDAIDKDNRIVTA